MFDPNSATVAPLFITLSVASAEAAAALSRASQIQAEIAHALGGDQGVALIPLSRPLPDLSRGWGSRPRNLDAPHAADVGKALEDAPKSAPNRAGERPDRVPPARPAPRGGP